MVALQAAQPAGVDSLEVGALAELALSAIESDRLVNLEVVSMVCDESTNWALWTSRTVVNSRRVITRLDFNLNRTNAIKRIHAEIRKCQRL
jgi:hypothetical protein